MITNLILSKTDVQLIPSLLENVEGGLKKRIHRDIEEALRYYEQEDADPNARKRYEVVDNRV